MLVGPATAFVVKDTINEQAEVLNDCPNPGIGNAEKRVTQFYNNVAMFNKTGKAKYADAAFLNAKQARADYPRYWNVNLMIAWAQYKKGQLKNARRTLNKAGRGNLSFEELDLWVQDQLRDRIAAGKNQASVSSQGVDNLLSVVEDPSGGPSAGVVETPQKKHTKVGRKYLTLETALISNPDAKAPTAEKSLGDFMIATGRGNELATLVAQKALNKSRKNLPPVADPPAADNIAHADESAGDAAIHVGQPISSILYGPEDIVPAIKVDPKKWECFTYFMTRCFPSRTSGLDNVTNGHAIPVFVISYDGEEDAISPEIKKFMVDGKGIPVAVPCADNVREESLVISSRYKQLFFDTGKGHQEKANRNDAVTGRQYSSPVHVNRRL